MSQLPDLSHPVDRIAFPLAVEAVLGMLAQGKAINPGDQAAAHDWIGTVLEGSDSNNNVKARAIHFVKRMVSGPLPV